MAVVFAFALLAIPLAVWAQSASNQLASGLNAASAIGLTTTDIRTVVARIINIAFGLLGLVAVVLIIYGGVLIMMARGDRQAIDKGKQVIISAAIGLLIIVSAYAIAQFVIRAIFGAQGGGGGAGGTGGGAAVTAGYCQGCGPEQLGNGIVSYHYPEANQRDVPRNISIAITFKKPLLLSTIFENYDDKGTYDLTDDRICVPDCDTSGHTETAVDTESLMLNTDNIKLLPANALGEVSGADADARFDNRYDSTSLVTDLPAGVSEVAATFDPNNLGQTLVITPNDPLGSSQNDVEYRVGLRGGDNGLQVWSWDATAGAAKAENAFTKLNPDGSYYWNFSTGTLLDVTPPTITAIVPKAVSSPSSSELYRNQLLQVYFSEAMNPLTVSGINGAGGGQTRIEVQANSGSGWQTLSGTWTIASGYKAVEFSPSEGCDMITENSCGDKVYCLPGDADLAVIVRAATVGTSPPRAQSTVSPNGAVDMVANSLDGDSDGTAEGPGTVNVSSYTGNTSSIPGTSVLANFAQDTVLWLYRVGDQVDLTAPEIVRVDPPNVQSESYSDGSSQFPGSQALLAEWSKPMSIGGIVTGPDSYTSATVTLRADEPRKDGQVLGAPSFTVEPSLLSNGNSLFTMKHRTFFTANDLGWQPEDVTDPDYDVPVYVPVYKARLKDTRQNCFYPSKAIGCVGVDDDTNPYCCNQDSASSSGAACNP